MKEKYRIKYETMSKKKIKKDLIFRTVKGGAIIGIVFGLCIGCLGLEKESLRIIAFLLSGLATIAVGILIIIKGKVPTSEEVALLLEGEITKQNSKKYDYFVYYALGGFVLGILASFFTVYYLI